MYHRPALVNTGGFAAGGPASGAAFQISLWLGLTVGALTLLFAALAVAKMLPAHAEQVDDAATQERYDVRREKLLDRAAQFEERS